MGLTKWKYTEEPIGEKKLVEVEEKFGFTFPADFKQCVIYNNGGFPDPNVFDCDDGRIEVVFNNLISFTNKDINIQMFYEFSAQKLIPFARDPYGNLLCFDYRYNEDSPKVVFFISEDEETSITPVCDTFTDLINRLYSIVNN
ncbi:SMI1/KNR4 family protein [Metabacillus endolithicus]|uniref:SMI1/KNR4 family protein n=1 Tax=Metabacillus endolithicus TaxID=1535204 RepID=A0ABW5BXX3_9BACI|nr:SMI1/KNR4 family protein [Metabacillus endolithicus]UPG65446.1 SMI1/KNR4 family protein [Metabacillus endolithicus]